jgi:hypothetical protein
MATPGKERAGDNGADGGGPEASARGIAAQRSHLTRQPARRVRNTVLLFAVVAAAVLGWMWKELGEEALVSAAYGARAGCVCRFVSGRSMESCEGQLAVAGLGRTGRLVWLSADEGARTVTASVPLLARQSATFSKDAGCQLEAWQD